MRNRLLCLGLFGLFALLPISAATIHPLADMDPTGFNNGGSSDSVRGWKFLANANLTVSELGANTPHPTEVTFSVMLWDFATQTLLAQSDFFSDGTNNWQWQAITPVSLSAGSEYIVSLYSATGNYYFQSFTPPSTWLPTGNVQYQDMRYANSATASTFPTSVLNNYQYGVVDIGYTLADVPEPGTWMMLSAGLLGMGVRLRAGKKRSQA